MMRHVSYPKIVTRVDAAAAGGPWIAQEKIHGAQVVIVVDASGAGQIGKRKDWLADDEPFFGVQLLRPALLRQAHELRARLGVEVLRVYGELFGGHYPHDDVVPAAGAQAVQTGIWYAPDIRFAAFDAVVSQAHDDDGRFVASSALLPLASAVGLFTPPVLGRGPRATLERLPVRFPSRVPALLGLPPMPDNVAEGYVLKVDAERPVAARAMVKRKVPEFDDARFDASLPFDAAMQLSAQALTAIAVAQVNPARVAAARSKVGHVAQAVVDEIALDVLSDLQNVYPAACAAVDPDVILDVVIAAARRAVGE